MSKKKILLLTLSSLIILWAVVGCNHQIHKNEKEEIIKIGFVGPFSGPASRFGQFMNNGLEMALSELSDREKNEIQIIKEDDKADGKTAVAVVQKLTETDKVSYVIGPIMNASVISTEGLFNNHQVTCLTAGLPNEKIANMGDYHFSLLPEIGLLKKYLARYIVEEKKIKKVATIYLNDSFGEELRFKFRKAFVEYGGNILLEESFERGSADVKTQLTKIKSINPEAVFIAAYSKDLIAVLKELEELGLEKLPKFGIHSFETPDILEEVAALAEGVIYPTFRQTGNSRPQSVDDYILKHKDKFNYYPDLYSAAVYDSFNILYGAIKKCGYENKKCVRQKLASVKDYQGANGLLTVDEKGVAIFDQARLRTVRQGKFEDL